MLSVPRPLEGIQKEVVTWADALAAKSMVERRGAIVVVVDAGVVKDDS